jgi:Holliday junction resolvase
LRDLQRTLKRCIAERFDFIPDVINGDTSAQSSSGGNRQARLRAFQERPGFGVIILSPLAIGFGVNIQAANHIIHFTRMWNPAKEDQATDRAYRIGQTKDVLVYNPVVVADSFTTFDAKLDKLLDWKRELSADMLNGTGDMSTADFADLEDVDGSNAFGNDLLKIEEIDSMSPDFFEAFCAILWIKQGYSKVYKTPRTGDGGIDVVAIQGKNGALIQCKTSTHEGKELGWEAIKDVVTGAAAYSNRHPEISFRKIAVTNQFFNSTAKKQAILNHVELFDQEQLSIMIKEKPVKSSELLPYLKGL